MSDERPVPNGHFQSLITKLNWRLLPFLLICYVFATLDRVNIGFAKLQMQGDLGLSDAAYGLGAGIFFIGYMMFEVPSNLMFPKWGARRTFSRILILWGLTSASMMFVRNETAFYILRFLLGVFEAGFAPGMFFYLTYWYGKANMGRVMGIVLLAGPLTGVISGPLSGGIMTHLAGAHGLHGWQWLFVLEGLPCVLLGILAPFVLSDKPADARWLSAGERALLASTEEAVTPKHHSFMQVARDPRVYLMAMVLFCLLNVVYAIAFWFPTLLKNCGVSDPLSIGWLSSIPSVVACVVMVMAGRISDRSGDRSRHVAIAALISAMGLAGATVFDGRLVPALMFMTVAVSMMYAAYTIFWAMPSEYLKGDSAAGGIGLINTLALASGFVSPNIIGLSTTLTGGTRAGMAVMVVLLFVGGCLALLLRHKAPQDAGASSPMSAGSADRA
ncbi:MFS transporter [Burkholderia stabilis]|uniref:MFS transporter n=1 Tax=Burkholderia stabilis TaxID=95485 RepID=A0A4Q2A8P9_9BURK|nr:MFS transporter [Burkholderia stabilis]RXV65030.1 MFS transporter [Burkholderia stabilis]